MVGTSSFWLVCALGDVCNRGGVGGGDEISEDDRGTIGGLV